MEAYGGMGGVRPGEGNGGRCTAAAAGELMPSELYHPGSYENMYNPRFKILLFNKYSKINKFTKSPSSVGGKPT